ncbi:M15 family metallopeptidase [Isoptericola cucumis]|uniref:D-alanyl-D-alanine carboxypeptidase-like core domain-containing protein n=1 Tax=Isoptericola cucumis TaxID=1776856 RepID=A0ABQ2B462_9MICO|nr:M15 family metallopeptidase [Isoptericola cucumis]GGI04716.1 hypothetical protein GCM10007368_02550 [Isoptericola cucumis]
MTENDIARSDAPQPDGSPEPRPTTPYRRRRDVHRPDAARRRAGSRRAAVPATLTAVALSAGLATGVAATASGSPDTTAAPTAESTPAGDGVTVARTTAAGAQAAPQDVSSAQAALARARTVAHDAVGLSDEQREKIARKADRLRALVTGEKPAANDAAASAKASRSSERVPVADRAEADATEKADKAEATPEAEAPAEPAAGQPATAAPDTADLDTADLEPVAAVAVGDAITHPTLLSDDIAIATADAPAGAGTTGTTATGAGSGGGQLAATPAASEKLASATDSLTTTIDRAQSSRVEIEAAPATPAEILTAQVQAAREAAPALAKHADDTRGYENGRIPSGDLAELSFASGETLRRDAAEQLERLNTAYRAHFGSSLEIRDSYRSYESQVSVKASRGYFAAVPGYSDHGLAVAVDLNGGVEEFGSAQYEWLRDVAPKFGWDNPGWARADGRKPEAWHWEYSAR